MLKKLERYEKRRLKLEKLIYDFCKGNNAELARRLGKEPSYVTLIVNIPRHISYWTNTHRL